MSHAYTLDVVGGIPDKALPPPMQVWWGTVRDHPFGLMTDVNGAVPVSADRVAVSHLGRVSAVIKCLAHDDVAAIAGIDTRQSIVFLSDELVPLAWHSTVISVNGSPVAAVTLAHRGLEFASGEDFIAHPFLMVRPAAGAGAWPPLRTVTAPAGE